MAQDYSPKTPSRSRPLLIPSSSTRSDSSCCSSPGDDVFDTPNENHRLNTPYTPPETDSHRAYRDFGSPLSDKSRRQIGRETNDYFRVQSETEHATSASQASRDPSRHSKPVIANRIPAANVSPLPINRALFTRKVNYTETDYAEVRSNYLSASQKTLDTIIPFKLKARWHADEEQCVASVAKYAERPQCYVRFKKVARVVRKQQMANVNEALGSLLVSVCNLDYDRALHDIDKIIENGMCGQHRRAAFSRRYGHLPNAAALNSQDGVLWLHAIIGINAAKMKDMPTSKTEAPSPPQLQKHQGLRKDSAVCVDDKKAWNAPFSIKKEVEIKNEEVIREVPGLTEPVKAKPQRPETGIVPKTDDAEKEAAKTVKGEAQIIRYPEFRPYQPGILAGLTTQEAIRLSVTASLSNNKDQRKGYIYIFRVKDDQDYVKIGYSIKPQQRLDDWRRDCNLDYQFLGSWQIFDTLIPHVSRVEKLIHSELKNYRQSFSCHSCSLRKSKTANHIEWFDVRQIGLEHVKQVCQRWIKWMLTGPYENKEGYWSLQPLEYNRFRQPLESASQGTEQYARKECATQKLAVTPKQPAPDQLKLPEEKEERTSESPAQRLVCPPKIAVTVPSCSTAKPSKDSGVSTSTKQNSAPKTAQPDGPHVLSNQSEIAHLRKEVFVMLTLRTSVEVTEDPPRQDTPKKQASMETPPDSAPDRRRPGL